MARNDTQQLIILGVAGYAAYRLAIAGKLGAGPQQAATQIRQGTSPGTGSAPAGCDSHFIPSVRYVGSVTVPNTDFSDTLTMYEVVTNGRRQSLHLTQAQAEAEYNRLVCGS